MCIVLFLFLISLLTTTVLHVHVNTIDKMSFYGIVHNSVYNINCVYACIII